MKLLPLIVIAAALPAAPVLARETALTDILDGIKRVQQFKMMDDTKTYELEARGVARKGDSDSFLRSRTPQEILESGLSTGCGDYAAAFYWLMQKKGLEVQYIDSAALNFDSLLYHFNGHTAVAVKDKDSGNWILVDPTFGKIVDADWDPKSGLYEGPAGKFWIGYKGPLEKFPAKGPDALKDFYGKTVDSVPKDVWERTLFRFVFTIDDSMKLKDGGYTNPHVLEFVRRPEEMYQKLGVNPARVVKVTLKDGGEEKSDDCTRNADGSWDCMVSRGAAMSARMTDWLAKRVERN